MNANEHDITATPLELAVDAQAGCIIAWCYPSSVEARYAAMQACHLVRFDYLDAVAQCMESTSCDADTARYMVARSVGNAVDKLRSGGAAPRRGVGPGGDRLDALGRPPQHNSEAT